MPGEQTTKRIGRPTELTKVVRHREVNGVQVPVTAGEQVIERRRLGLDIESAAASAGVSRISIHTWRLDGARVRAIEAQGKRELTPHEALFRGFVDDLERAESEWEANNLAVIQRAAQGGFVSTKTVEKRDAAGDLIERSVTTETLHPQWQAAAWQLERLRRDKYARRWEVTGADGKALIPEADQARNLADQLRDYMQGVEDEKKAKRA